MNELNKLKIDLQGYSLIQKLSFFLDPSILGAVNFRISSFLYRIKFTKLFYILYWPFWRVISTLVGIEIHGGTDIGFGLRIFHFGGIFINEQSKIGNNCIIYTGVVIGSKDYIGGFAPKIGDNVNIGAGAKILGNISVGNNVNVGAMSVVTKDIADSRTVCGIPAKVIS